jgi:hypothetical protein
VADLLGESDVLNLGEQLLVALAPYLVAESSSRASSRLTLQEGHSLPLLTI